MKLAVVFFGVAFLACAINGAPVGSEDEPETVPQPLDGNVRISLSKAILEQIQVLVEEGSSKTPKLNVIDAPKVCPEGQLLDHQGKCRPVLG